MPVPSQESENALETAAAAAEMPVETPVEVPMEPVVTPMTEEEMSEAQLARRLRGRLATDAEEWMFAHAWPGNIRELKNRIERGVLIGKPPHLSARDLKIESEPARSAAPESPEIDFPPGGVDFTALMESLRRQYIERALKMAEGNEAKAARLLKLNPHTFRYHCKKLKQS